MASTIKVNSIEAQSSTDVNIPPGFKLKVADAGELYVGGAAITTGATQVTSRNTNTVIDVGASGDINLTGKSLSVISVDASSGTGAIITITLPAASTFSTTAIQVVSAAAHGTDNKIVINTHLADGGTEIYTLHHLGDYCELVSDGTSVLRTGNEFATIRGRITMTTGIGVYASAMSDTWDLASSSNYSVSQVGAAWSSTTDDFTAPYAGLYQFGGFFTCDTGQYASGWQYYDGVASAYYTSAAARHQPNGTNTASIMLPLSKDDKIEWHNSNHSSACTALGAGSGGDRCSAEFHMIRRY